MSAQLITRAHTTPSHPIQRHQTLRLPREHGFWVMAGIAALAGVLLARCWTSLGVAVALLLVLIFGAASLGRRIRKNVVLQLLAAPVLACIVGPIASSGAVSLRTLILVTFSLTTVFSSTTLAVQSILLQARRRWREALFTRWAAPTLSVAGATGAFLLDGRRAGVVLLSCAVVLGGLGCLQPSARRLKRVGISIGIGQLLAALALTL